MTLYYYDDDDVCLEFMTGLIKELAKTTIQAASMMDVKPSGILAIIICKAHAT